MSKFLFEGDFKRKPVQNLGGRSRITETRDITLKKAQLERQRREQERARASAILVLQAGFRGMRERRKLSSQLLDEFRANTASEYALDVLERQMMRLNYFFRPRRDLPLLSELGKSMLLHQNELIANVLTDDRSRLRLLSVLEKGLSVFSEPSQISRTIVLRLLETFTDWNKVEFARLKLLPSLDRSKTDDVMAVTWSHLVLQNNFFERYRMFLENKMDVSDEDSARKALQHYDFAVFYQRFLEVMRHLSTTSRKFSVCKETYVTKQLVQALLLNLANSLSKSILKCKASKGNGGVVKYVICPRVSQELALQFEDGRTLWTDEWLQVISKLIQDLTVKSDAVATSLNLRPVMYCFLFMTRYCQQWHVRQDDILKIINSLMISIDNRNSTFLESYGKDEEELLDELEDCEMKSVEEIEMAAEFFSDRQQIYGEMQVVLNEMRLNQWMSEFSIAKWSVLYPVISCIIGIEPRMAALHFTFLPTFAYKRTFMRSLCIYVMKKDGRAKEELTVLCWLMSHLMSILHDGEFLHSIPLNKEELLMFILLLQETYAEIILSDNDLMDPLSNCVKKEITHTLTAIHDRNTRMSIYSEDVFLSSKFAVVFPMETHGIKFKDFDKTNRPDNTLPLLDQRLLRVLNDFPFALSFHDRVSIWHQMIRSDHIERQISDNPLNRQHIQIRRSYIYEDAYEKLSPENVPDLRSDVRISLVNVVGVEEAGVDGGGLLREFLTEATKAGVDPNRGLFRVDSQNRIYPNPVAKKIFSDYRKHFFLMGRLVGKALYRQILLELPLAAFFLQLCAFGSVSSAVDYLATLDPDLHKNLLTLKCFKGDWSELGLDFTLASEELGETRVVELKPNGRNIVVDATNVIEYIHLVADYKINREMAEECKFFRLGLFDVVPILRIFSWREMQTLISGSDKPIDVEDWKVNTNYGEGYGPTHKTIIMFWQVVEHFDEAHLRKLLKFVTSCSRPPLLGFKDLVPKFGVSNAGVTNRLPTAATCMNLLKLPEFNDVETLRERLVYAISAQAGFELS